MKKKIQRKIRYEKNLHNVESCISLSQFVIPSNQKADYPMFLFCEGSRKDLQQGIEVDECLLASTSSFDDHDALEDDLCECEKFELLQ